MPTVLIHPTRVQELAVRLRVGADCLDLVSTSVAHAARTVDLSSTTTWHAEDRADRFRRAAIGLDDAAERILGFDLEVDERGRHLPESAGLFTRLSALIAMNVPLLGLHGDPGETLRPSWRGDLPAASTGDGGATLAWMIAVTGQRRWVGEDEFAIVDHGDGRYTAILPGVIDLSRPDRGLNDHHRSARDVDVGAIDSFLHDGVDNNIYAQLVADFLLTELPAGSEVALVGHSYGADTAADIAADPRFTGGDVTVTHALLAAYDSEPQLDAIPADIEVLILQNENDWVAKTEGVIRHGADPSWPWSDSPPPPPATHRVVRFDGGSEGFGHHQDNYTAPILDGETPAIDDFAERFAEAGFTEPGEVWAIDVSVPE